MRQPLFVTLYFLPLIFNNVLMASCFSGGKAWMARMMWLSSSVMEAQKSQLLPCSSLPLQYMPGRPTRIQMGIWKKSAIFRSTEISGE